MVINLRKIIFLLCVALYFTGVNITQAEPNWVWYYSSDYVSEFYDPSSLKIVRDIYGNIDRIEVWAKTTYSKAGADDAINDYGLESKINSADLNQSISKIYIKPQSRQITWKQEVFYDLNGKSLWSNEQSEYSLDWSLVAPESASERYYSFIIDQVFNNGTLLEFNRWETNNDRWVNIGAIELDGTVQHWWFDKASIVLNENEIIFWEFDKSVSAGEVIAKDLNRSIYDKSAKTLQLVRMSTWRKDRGWIVENYAVYDRPYTIIPGSIGERNCQAIEKYVNEHTAEILRYSTGVSTSIAK